MTSVLPTSAANAFFALRETVVEMEAHGRVTRIAGVKPQLKRRQPDFDERRLGFRSFGAFVQAAARQGAVEVVEDEDGWTRIVAPGGSSRGPDTLDRLRQDIWRAFTVWGEGWLRCWDRATARAIRIPAVARPGESEEQQALRSALLERSGSVIPIDPVPQEEQERWMRAFVADLGDHALVRPLEAALDDDRPFRTFSAVLQADLDLRRRFNRFKLARVLDAVRVWAAANNVDLDSVDHHAAVPRAKTPTAARSTKPPGDIDTLRAALHRAVDEMPVEDLRRVSIPVGYFLDALR